MARIEDSPWAISVAQVASRAGQSKEIDATFPAPSGIGDEIVGAEEGAYEDKSASVASGKGGKNGKGGVKEEEVDIIAGEDESEDSYPLLEGGSWADIETLLRDTLVEELPLQPLCKPDCLGLCSQCGADLNEDPDHHHDVTDIRFAALEGLKARLEGNE